MYIKIVGFRNHIDAEFVFEDGKMSLLRGISGSGKTTILQAIFWVLYGNMRDIYNDMNIIKTLSVTLVLENITIFRKKNPELLTLQMNDKLYEDQIAQSIINTKFGNRDLWKACSYIEQKSRCDLLKGSNKEKMEVLNFLSFSGENPKDYILKISEKLKEVTNEFSVGQTTYLTEIELFSKQLQERPIKFLKKEEEIDRLKENLNCLEKKEKEKQSEVLDQERILGTRQYLIETNKKLEDQLKFLQQKKIPDFPEFKENPKPVLKEIEIPDIPLVEIPELDKKTVISYSDYIQQKNKLGFKNIKYSKKDLEKELENIEKIEKIEYEEVSEQEIWQVSKVEKEREYYSTECQNLGLEYDKTIIDQNLEILRKQLDYLLDLEKNVENYNRLLEIEKNIKKIEDSITIKENLETLVQEKSYEIVELKKGLELLPCPNCQASLRYRNGNLSLGERDPVSIKEIENAQREYEEISRNLKLSKELSSLKQKASVFSFNREEMEKFERNKIVPLKNLIGKIEKIKYIEIPKISSEFLTKIFLYQKSCKRREDIFLILEEIKIQDEIKKQLDVLENKYKLEQERVLKNQELTQQYQKKETERLEKIRYYENLKNSNLQKFEKHKENEEKRYREYLIEKNRHENEKKRVSTDISALKKRIEENLFEIDNCKIDKKCKEQYQNILKQIEEIRTEIEEGIYGNKVKKRSEELEKKREALVDLQKDMTTLDRLRSKAIGVECKQLEDTVANININLETTLSIFFPEPISLRLLLYKKIKTGNKIKPGLNLEICYKGKKYDKIDRLSGGEGDRISLALLLALNYASNSPLILLDECVSSLDPNLKTACINGIKSIPNKTVICIDHDDSLEGYYNSIIEI